MSAYHASVTFPPQRLQSKESELDDWEPKRIERPAGTPEWGVPPALEERPATKSKAWFSRKPVQAEEEIDQRGVSSYNNLEPLQSSSQSTKRGKAVILGPDGKPCRACNSKLAFSAAMKGAREPASTVTATIGTGEGGKEAKRENTTQCPPDGETIGNSTWTFLHSAAAYYPNQPSEIQQESMLALVRSLVHLYPCHSCAEAFGQELVRETESGQPWRSQDNQPDSGSVVPLTEAVKRGSTLRLWLCGVHNEVNERLGKPVWRCDEESLSGRWKDGPADGSCD